MFPRSYFALRYFAIRYWPQSQGAAAAPPVVITVSGGSYGPLKEGKKKKKRKPAPWERESLTPGQSLREQLQRINDLADEEELIAMIRFEWPD